MSADAKHELRRIYDARFAAHREYRKQVWRVLVKDCFSRYIGPNDGVLDLGCGYGEFISAVQCGRKYAMDLNPDARRSLEPDVLLLEQDCSTRWAMDDASLDVVFTSNFFEHLPDKPALGRTLDEVYRCLRSGGRLVAMGPNIKYLAADYWDFWDHHLPLSHLSLSEGLVSRGLVVETCVGRFLPYTMSSGPHYPTILLRFYLRFRIAWSFFGKQFLIVAVKPQSVSSAADGDSAVGKARDAVI
ncbi:MAG: class I SAM-dependent methyltransferase [Planctomycetaceae bacterium]